MPQQASAQLTVRDAGLGRTALAVVRFTELNVCSGVIIFRLSKLSTLRTLSKT